MQISNNCINLVAKWEGFYSKAYVCPAGVLTIGYGTTKWQNGKAVKKGDTITKNEASALLEEQVNEHASTIEHYVKVPLNQNQFDALASFQYNLGRHILKGSSLLKYLNEKQWDKACNSMMQYCKARNPKSGKLEVLRGLENRRKEEVALFKKAVVAPVKKEVEEDELAISSPALKAETNETLASKARRQKIVDAAVKAGATKTVWQKKLEDGTITDGDLLALAAKAIVDAK